MKPKARKRENGKIPDDAVLLIPEPENADEKPTCGIKSGYYNLKQMLELINRHKGDAEAIRFIADMLETGNAEDDGFAILLRQNCTKPIEIQRIIEICSL